mgnify:CR=1 FL=1
MYKSINSWIEYLHPKLGYPIVARIEDEEEIKLKQYKIIKKVVNMECIYSSSEAWSLFFFMFNIF